MADDSVTREPETLEEWRDAYFAVLKDRNNRLQNNAPRTGRMDLHDELDERFPLFEDFKAFADAAVVPLQVWRARSVMAIESLDEDKWTFPPKRPPLGHEEVEMLVDAVLKSLPLAATPTTGEGKTDG